MQQHGSLVLAALPDEVFGLNVTRISPVSEQVDGGNVFRVEATLDRTTERLRPNMEGVARLEIGRARLIWIWTHHLVEAARIELWSWWP
jgi:hypothetical protein